MLDGASTAFNITRESIRVLKKGGDIVVSYPSGRGSSGLASEAGSSIAGKLRRGNFIHYSKVAFAAVGATLAYAPLALYIDTRRTALSRDGIKSLLESVGIKIYSISEDPRYQDFVVSGKR